MSISQFQPNDKGNPPGKLADAEVHFTEGALAGLKLIGFAIWERRGGAPALLPGARVFGLNGPERKSGRPHELLSRETC